MYTVSVVGGIKEMGHKLYDIGASVTFSICMRGMLGISFGVKCLRNNSISFFVFPLICTKNNSGEECTLFKRKCHIFSCAVPMHANSCHSSRRSLFWLNPEAIFLFSPVERWANGVIQYPFLA
jgi:hypothetical protein